MRNKSSFYSRYYTYIKPIIKMPIVRTYGSTIFTLLMMAIFIVFAIRPTISTIVVLQKKLADSNQVLEKVNLKANSLSLGKKNYDNLDLDIKTKISAAIPDTLNLQSITRTLEQTVISHDASVSALQIQPLTIDVKKELQVGTQTEINFTFNVQGAYPNLVSLLRDFRSSSRLISIDSVSLSKVSEGTGLIMSISGKAYYIK